MIFCDKVNYISMELKVYFLPQKFYIETLLLKLLECEVLYCIPNSITLLSYHLESAVILYFLYSES
jgi:hypothetical protein